MEGSKMKKSIVFICVLFTVCFISVNTFGGCIKGNCQNGQGTIITPDGEKYVGKFKDGKFNGQGTITSPDGEKYVGEFNDGKINGQGTYTIPNGTKYVGEWKDGKFNGTGNLYFSKWNKICR